MKIMSIITMILVLAGCSGPQRERSTHADTEDTTPLQNRAPTVEMQRCYLHVNGRDSVHIAFEVGSDSVEGTLYFNNYQFDDSRGTIRGRFHGDTLKVVNDYLAEGMRSRSQEAFLKKGDSLIRGFGDRHLVNDTMTYSAPEDVSFENGQVFRPTPCP